MTYSEVTPLKIKQFYTKRDVDALLIDSMLEGVSMTLNQAKFIVKCSAVHHGTDYSKYVAQTEGSTK